MIKGTVDPKADPDALEKLKISWCCREPNQDFLGISHVAVLHTDWVTSTYSRVRKPLPFFTTSFKPVDEGKLSVRNVGFHGQGNMATQSEDDDLVSVKDYTATQVRKR
jgi:hypothetical protein